MFHIRKTPEFDIWLKALSDRDAKHAITGRLQRVELGLMGDTYPVGEGVHELRFDIGPGYRVYFFNHLRSTIFLLSGGNKTTQSTDIKNAIAKKKELIAKDKKAREVLAEKESGSLSSKDGRKKSKSPKNRKIK